MVLIAPAGAMRTFLYSLSPSQASWIGKGGIGGPAMALRRLDAHFWGGHPLLQCGVFLFLVSGSFNVDKAFHNRAVFRLWKGVLACSCSRVSDWLVGLVWRAVDLEEPRCCGPFARLLESRAKGLRALAYWPRRPLRAAGADTLLSRFGV